MHLQPGPDISTAIRVSHICRASRCSKTTYRHPQRWKTISHHAEQEAIPLQAHHAQGSSTAMSASTSPCCSSACSTLIWPAGLHTFPAVIFHSRTRPSFPADDRIVLQVRQYSSRQQHPARATHPVMFHSTRPTVDLHTRQHPHDTSLNEPTHLWSSKSPTMLAPHLPSTSSASPSRSSPGVGGRTRHILTCPSRLPVATRW